MVDGSIENGDLDNRHLSGNIFPSFREQRPSPREEAAHLEQSYFDETVPRNVTVLIGKSAYLSCRVRNLGNKSVSTLCVCSVLVALQLLDIMMRANPKTKNY